MTSECLNCHKPLEQIPHKRPKQFCNSTCRSNFWQKQNRKKEGVAKKKEIAEAAIEWKPAHPASFDSPKQVRYDDEPPQFAAPAFRPYQELLRLAPTLTEREEREAFKLEVSRHPKLTAGQKGMIHSKLPKLNP